MEISDQLLCLFSGRVETKNGSYVVEVPEQELEYGDVDAGEAYRIAVLPPLSDSDAESTREAEPAQEPEPTQQSQPEREPKQAQSSLEPPVEKGEMRTVDIEGVGEQGDGIARVERGFVVIVPDTDKGERVRIEIDQVRENVAFANVVERQDYYE